MHPSIHAKSAPERPAVIMAESGRVVSYGELDRRSNQGAHLLRALGVATADVVAILLDNDPAYFELVWAAQRAGTYMVAISSRLTTGEIEYIFRDSGAKALITSASVAAAAKIADWQQGEAALFMIGAATGAYRSWDQETAKMPETPIADERAGADMLYSSGTTGRPKGVQPPLPATTAITTPTWVSQIAETRFDFGPDTVYLCPAPLYHAAPLRWSMSAHRLGGTVVVMEKFDAERALALIEEHRITHSQWVPTHFVRMLKLPEAVRSRYDLSTMRHAIHAAAPCPVPIKQAMVDWWGPIITEYYAGTEANGMTMTDSAGWSAHPGSVGEAIFGRIHIVDEDGKELPPRSEGLVYFEGGNLFAYHNDPEKTAQSRLANGWTTLGDIGWLDEDGFLYLTDRKSFTIISGGVNIYPQEIENLLVTHPKVLDVAIVGGPDPEMGEQVVAIIQPMRWEDANDDTAQELTDWLQTSLSRVKIPRRFLFRKELPRHPTGKLYKRLLRDELWQKAAP